MMPVWIAAGLIFCGAALLVICRAAAAGDRVLERARRDLAGASSRNRPRLGAQGDVARFETEGRS